MYQAELSVTFKIPVSIAQIELGMGMRYSATGQHFNLNNYYKHKIRL